MLLNGCFTNLHGTTSRKTAKGFTKLRAALVALMGHNRRGALAFGWGLV